MPTPTKKTRIKISKNPLSFRPRSKVVEIVVDGENEEAGALTLTICEIPKGLFADLRDEIEAATDAHNELIEEEKRARLNFATALREAREKGLTPEALFDLKQSSKATLEREIENMREERKGLRAEANHHKLTLVRWGVCDHKAECFELDSEEELDGDDQVEQLPGEDDDDSVRTFLKFEKSSDAYDGVSYLVAHPDMITAYQSAGQPFVEALYYAIIAWQEGRYVPPAKVWSETKRINAAHAKKIEERVKEMMTANGVTATPAEADELLKEIEGVHSEAPLVGRGSSTS